jgi:hypothetical protein
MKMKLPKEESMRTTYAFIAVCLSFLFFSCGMDAVQRQLAKTERVSFAGFRITGNNLIVYVDPVGLEHEVDPVKADLILLLQSGDPDIEYNAVTFLPFIKPSTIFAGSKGSIDRIKALYPTINTRELVPGKKTELIYKLKDSEEKITAEAVPAVSDRMPAEKKAIGAKFTLDGIQWFFAGASANTPEILGLTKIDIAIFDVCDGTFSPSQALLFAKTVQPKYIIPTLWKTYERSRVNSIAAASPMGTKALIAYVYLYKGLWE